MLQDEFWVIIFIIIIISFSKQYKYYQNMIIIKNKYLH